MPLLDWVVVAGPPGLEIGSRYYAPFLEAAARARKGGKRASASKNDAQCSEIEGTDPVRSPRVSRYAWEPQHNLPGIRAPEEAISAELGALKPRGADGLLLDVQQWTRRVSSDDVVSFATKLKCQGLPTAPQPNMTRCFTCGKRKAAGPSRFCCSQCRNDFDDGAEPYGMRR